MATSTSTFLTTDIDESIGSKWLLQSRIDIPLKEMMPILLNKFIRYPESVYTKYVYTPQDPTDKSGLKLYFIHLPSSLLGIEYSKTHVYHSDHSKEKFASFAKVVSGNVTTIIQRNGNSDADTNHSTFVDDVKLVSLKQEEKIAIPSGYYYAFINHSEEDAIISVFCKTLKRLNYTDLIKEKGLAFYIISKNSRMEIVANPRYKISSKINIHTSAILTYVNDISDLFNLMHNVENVLLNQETFCQVMV